MKVNFLLSRSVIFTVLALLILQFAQVYFFYIPVTQAASVTTANAVLVDPTPSSNSDHIITFTTPSGADEGDTIVIAIDSSGDTFDLSGVTEDDIDIEDDGTDLTTAATCGSVNASVGINTSTDEITFTICAGGGGAIAASSEVVIKIGTNATASGTGVNQINNPAKVAVAGTADIYTIGVSGTFGDSGSLLVSIIEGVGVTVTVEEFLSFAVNSVVDSNCTQGGSGSAVSTSATGIPFGAGGLSADTFYKACQDLLVTSNAGNGYTISLFEDTSMLNSNGDTLDDTSCDASDCTHVVGASTTTSWTSASNNGLGYTCSGGACDSAFNGATEFNRIACIGSDAQCDPGSGGESAGIPVANSTTANAETSRIIYKMSYDVEQPPGDYSNTITYIITGTF